MITTNITVAEKLAVASNLYRKIDDSQSYAQGMGSKSSYSKEMDYTPQNPDSYSKKIGDFGSNSKHIKPNNMPDEDYYSKSNNDSSKFLSVFKNLFNQY